MVDLNCDMGEGMGNDPLIMPFISSANIACGYHAGDTGTIRRTIDLCLQYKVAIGVHPSFYDRENFGRTRMLLEPAALYDLVSEQLVLFAAIARDAGAVIHHVKPHGALYNMAAADRSMAMIIANAVVDFDSTFLLYGLSGSCLVDAGKKMGLVTASEVFADRSYQQDGSLTPRNHTHSLIKTEEQAVKQVLQMVLEQSVSTANGEIIPVKAETVCIHGDQEHAAAFAKAIHNALSANGVKIGPA